MRFVLQVMTAADERAKQQLALAEAERKAADERAKYLMFGLVSLVIVIIVGGAAFWFKRKRVVV